MYVAMIVLLMAVLPIGSILVEALVVHADASWLMLVGKWFVFWGVGLRLLIAGIRQVTKPAFTAETIFELKDPAAFKVVRELGFSNLCFGVIGLASIAAPSFVLPAAIAGGLYYGLAGVMHIGSRGRNATETWAMASDLGIFLVLAIYVVATLLQR